MPPAPPCIPISTSATDAPHLPHRLHTFRLVDMRPIVHVDAFRTTVPPGPVVTPAALLAAPLATGPPILGETWLCSAVLHARCRRRCCSCNCCWSCNCANCCCCNCCMAGNLIVVDSPGDSKAVSRLRVSGLLGKMEGKWRERKGLRMGTQAQMMQKVSSTCVQMATGVQCQVTSP